MAQDQSQEAPVSKFVLVTSPVELRKLFNSAVDNQVRALVQIEEVRLELVVSDQSLFGKQIVLCAPHPADGLLFEKRWRAGKSAKILLFVKNQAIIAFQTKLLSMFEPEYKFEFPSKVFKMQRRRKARYVIPRGLEILVEIPNPEGRGEPLRRRLVDISTEGISFRVVSRREASYFLKGRIINGIRVTLQGVSISMDGEVRSQLPMKEGSAETIKVGLKIVRIEPEDLEYLTSFIFVYGLGTLE